MKRGNFIKAEDGSIKFEENEIGLFNCLDVKDITLPIGCAYVGGVDHFYTLVDSRAKSFLEMLDEYGKKQYDKGYKKCLSEAKTWMKSLPDGQ